MIDLISFKGAQYPKSVILYAVYFYVRFPVSYRDLEEIMAERGVDLDHATLNRWVVKYAGAIAEEAHRGKSPTGFCRKFSLCLKAGSLWTRLSSESGKLLECCGSCLIELTLADHVCGLNSCQCCCR